MSSLRCWGVPWIVLGVILFAVGTVYGLERYTVGGKGRRWEDEAATTVPETWPDGEGVRLGTILLDAKAAPLQGGLDRLIGGVLNG